MGSIRSGLLTYALWGAGALALAGPALADPRVTRLTPPSRRFSTGDATGPVTARFLPGQRFDLQATVVPDEGQAIAAVRFLVDGRCVPGTVTLTPATVEGLPAGATVATLRAHASDLPGVRTLSVEATQSDAKVGGAAGDFEIVPLACGDRGARNVIVLIGDGMGVAHRTAARLMRHGVTQGKADGRLAMDRMPYTGLVMTHSLNSIVTDSSPGAACYATGNKAHNHQHGVFPDDTAARFDNPRVELLGEYLHRTRGASLGIVTTSDVFDATPAAFASHTQSRAAGTGICDQYFDERTRSGLRVLLGGGRKWFLPATTVGSARGASTDEVLPAELAAGWGVPAGAVDPDRDLLADFVADGWAYVPTRTALAAAGTPSKLLGLFALSNMNVAKDKVDGRRGHRAVVDDYGFPDQPLLDEMARAALEVLARDDRGFVLMVEGASIDKQAHNMDTERWILDTLEFDDAVEACLAFAEEHPDTLVVVTADHECGGINVVGGALVTDAALRTRAASGGGAAQLRRGVVGTYESAGFPRYVMAADGYPVTTDPDFRMLVGYAANADRYEDWRTNPLPLRDVSPPSNGLPPWSSYPGGPLERDVAGGYLVTGQIPDAVAAHTASDVPLSAAGHGAARFTGVMDNTDVFFRILRAVAGERDDARPPAGGDDEPRDDRDAREAGTSGRRRR